MIRNECVVVGTMGKYATQREKHQNNEEDLEKFLSKHYKDNYLIFNFSYALCGALIGVAQ